MTFYSKLYAKRPVRPEELPWIARVLTHDGPHSSHLETIRESLQTLPPIHQALPKTVFRRYSRGRFVLSEHGMRDALHD